MKSSTLDVKLRAPIKLSNKGKYYLNTIFFKKSKLLQNAKNNEEIIKNLNTDTIRITDLSSGYSMTQQDIVS